MSTSGGLKCYHRAMRTTIARLSIFTMLCLQVIPVAAVARPPFPARPVCNAIATTNEGKGDLAVASTGAPDAGTLIDDPYGSTYTPEMLAVIDQALHAINCSRADLLFQKEYGKGHACFPAVHDMLRDPLAIAPFTVGLADAASAAGPQAPLLGIVRAVLADDHVMPYEEWAASSEWNYAAGEMAGQGHRAQLEMGISRWIDNNTPLQNESPLDAALRWKLPSLLAWHDVFVLPSSVTSARRAEVETWLADQPGDWWAQAMTADTFYSRYFSDPAVVDDFLLLSGGFIEFALSLPPDFWPATPEIRQTAYGAVCIGTPGADTYRDLDFAFLIEPGGGDHYIGCRLAGVSDAAQRDQALALDLGGDDFYDCAEVDFTLGAAVLGCAAFYDLGQGDDRYAAGNASLGAAMGGVALFYDDGGSDSYSGKVFTQGAAGFGIGVMVDDSVQPAPVVATDVETPDPIDIGAFDNDTYTAWSSAQAFARTRGVALCLNRRGNETYHAGGVYLHAPLFTDRYQSFSQGFAIGERDIDYAGGIALLADYGGNDRYLGDIYNQGVGYWYSAGLLYDGAGNDTYEMTQYGQGSGIHLAVGGLVDEGGHDTYVMHSGLGQGSSHDYATSVLLDRGGNDKYYGTTTSCGASLTNSACLFIDGAGDDTYAARNEGGLNYGRPARDAGSIGLFIDMAGKDDYLGKMRDSSSWTSTQYGSGVDSDPATMVGQASVPADSAATEGRATGSQPSQSAGGLAVPTEKTVIPEIVGYEGALTQAVFDELWGIAIRWEVGDNQLIVPKARERLVAFGPEVLPYVEAKMDDPNSLAIRGYVDVLKPFAWKPAAAPADKNTQAAGDQSPAPPQPAETLSLVEALLARQLASGSEPRQVAALSVVGELALPGVAGAVAGLLDSPDLGMQRRALGTLGLLGSHNADGRILTLLDPTTDERLLKTAIATAAKLKLDCYPQFRALLDVPKFTARDTLVGMLAAQYATYGTALRADFLAPEGLSVTAQRTLLRSYLGVKEAPDAYMLQALHSYLGKDDWGLRSDAAALVAHWHTACHADPLLESMFSRDETGLEAVARRAQERTDQPWPQRN